MLNWRIIGLFPMSRSVLAFQLYVFKGEFAVSDISTAPHHASSEKKPILVRVITGVLLPLDIGSIIANSIMEWDKLVLMWLMCASIVSSPSELRELSTQAVDNHALRLIDMF